MNRMTEQGVFAVSPGSDFDFQPQIFNIGKRQRETEGQHNLHADNIAARH